MTIWSGFKVNGMGLRNMDQLLTFPISETGLKITLKSESKGEKANVIAQHI